MLGLLLATVTWHPMIVHRWVDKVVECEGNYCTVILDDTTPAIVYHKVVGGEFVTCRVRIEDESVHCVVAP